MESVPASLSAEALEWIFSPKHRLEPRFHLRPLRIQNAEVNRVAHAPPPCDQVPAQCALFFRAEAEDGVARSLIEGICFQLDPHTFPGLECVPEHQVFCFRVDRSAMPGRHDPGETNLHAAIDAVDIHKSGAADDPPRTTLNGCKYDRLAAPLLVKGLLNHKLKVLAGLQAVRKPFENIIERMLGNLPECPSVFALNRFQSHNGTLQRNRRYDFQRRIDNAHRSFLPRLGPLSCILRLFAASLLRRHTCRIKGVDLR